MPGEGKRSVVGELSAAMAAEGSSDVHTPLPAENAGGEDALGDLFRALDDELDAFDGATIAPPKRRAGRPVGSPNRSTLQLQRYLMSRGYRDPAEFLASLMSMDTVRLAQLLAGGTAPTFKQAAAALKAQVQAAGQLMPYFHKRLPQAVEVTNDGARPMIVIMDGSRTIIDGGESMSVLDLVSDQGLSIAAPDMSHDDGSHDDD